VKFLLKQAYQSLIGGVDHTQPPRLVCIPDLGRPRPVAAQFHDLSPDRRRNTYGRKTAKETNAADHREVNQRR
jgi:hypothetical protein